MTDTSKQLFGAVMSRGDMQLADTILDEHVVYRWAYMRFGWPLLVLPVLPSVARVWLLAFDHAGQQLGGYLSG